jgi:DNA-binding beta-propeller fold protein YncE
VSLEHLGYIELPTHVGKGGFDHAAGLWRRGLLYVAHTANDTVDVIDCAAGRHAHSVEGLTAVAGALTAPERDLVFTSNRGEDTVGIFGADRQDSVVKVAVGRRPNGLAHDNVRNVLLAANVGDSSTPGSATVSIVDVKAHVMVASVTMPGRTRWALFSERDDAFFVNIADPSQIAVIGAGDPTWIAKVFDIPAVGPHGLDLDVATGTLFCACDSKSVIALDARSGKVRGDAILSGAPDVIFLNAALGLLYVASGDPGVIDVVDAKRMKVVETIYTEPCAHTTALDASSNRL